MSTINPPPSPEQQKINRLGRVVQFFGAVLVTICVVAAGYSIWKQLHAGERVQPVPFTASPSASSSG